MAKASLLTVKQLTFLIVKRKFYSIKMPIRRPIPMRETKWAIAIAKQLKNIGMRPNQISILSVVFSGLSGACLVIASRISSGWHIPLLISSGVFIQLRLLCNMLDGMVAIEGGLKTKTGELFNELPDRISDVLILVGAGYSIKCMECGVELGWLAAVLSVLTAYVRALGGAIGAAQYFSGPMAKQHRMHIMTASCLITVLEVALGRVEYVMTFALGIIAIGCVITVIRRVCYIVKDLETK